MTLKQVLDSISDDSLIRIRFDKTALTKKNLKSALDSADFALNSTVISYGQSDRGTIDLLCELNFGNKCEKTEEQVH